MECDVSTHFQAIWIICILDRERLSLRKYVEQCVNDNVIFAVEDPDDPDEVSLLSYSLGIIFLKSL